MSKNKLIGPKSPFDDISLSHLVLGAVAELGADIKDQRKFINRLRHIEYGLSAEDECAAILAWLGNCLMVHKLFQEGYSSPELGNIQIPDLLAVFSNGEERFCAAIEVKCNDDLFLPWKEEYREKLSRYGDLLGVPVLLAWRPSALSKLIM